MRVGHGEDGECLPVAMPGSENKASRTFRDVRDLFPDGVAASSDDQLGLDRDGDGIACGQAD